MAPGKVGDVRSSPPVYCGPSLSLSASMISWRNGQLVDQVSWWRGRPLPLLVKATQLPARIAFTREPSIDSKLLATEGLNVQKKNFLLGAQDLQCDRN